MAMISGQPEYSHPEFNRLRKRDLGRSQKGEDELRQSGLLNAKENLVYTPPAQAGSPTLSQKNGARKEVPIQRLLHQWLIRFPSPNRKQSNSAQRYSLIDQKPLEIFDNASNANASPESQWSCPPLSLFP